MILAGCLIAASNQWAALRCEGADNQLTDEEREAGWRLLFDGGSFEGWRSFGKTTFPDSGWVIEDGWLKHIDNGGGGDIITDEKFSEFDLRWEWRIGENGNSGLKYFIDESRGGAVGHEYQLLDDAERLADRDAGEHSTSSFYDVLRPDSPRPNPAGEVNKSRILVKGDRVQHWLNGKKVLEYRLGSDELMEAVENSKFRNVEGFGLKLDGHILLQDHGDEILFRNIKIREFNAD